MGIAAQDQADAAAKIGLTIDDDGRPLDADGTPLVADPLHSPPKGYAVDYAHLPGPVAASIDNLSNLPDYTPPPGVDPNDPACLEWVAAAYALHDLELKKGDPRHPSPGQQEMRDAHARYTKADEWYQAQLAEHRRTVQVAHGVPLGPNQSLGTEG